MKRYKCKIDDEVEDQDIEDCDWEEIDAASPESAVRKFADDDWHILGGTVWTDSDIVHVLVYDAATKQVTRHRVDTEVEPSFTVYAGEDVTKDIKIVTIDEGESEAEGFVLPPVPDSDTGGFIQ